MKTADLVDLARARRYATSGDGGRIRAAASLSLHEVADAAGCSVTTVWRWERGERAPRGAAAVAWARLLNDLQRASVKT